MPQDNGTFTPEEVEAVKAQLTAELQTRDQAVEQLQTALNLAREEATAVKAGREQDALAGQTALDEANNAVTVARQEITTLKATGAAAAELQAALSQVKAELEANKQAHEAARDDLSALREGLKTAAGKHRSLLLASNPAIPEELVQGEDIGALEASMEKARTIVEKVRAAIKTQDGQTPVPPGAPPRSAPDIESLSATDKIKFALRGK